MKRHALAPASGAHHRRLKPHVGGAAQYGGPPTRNSHRQMLMLQRTLGNRASVALINRQSAASMVIQRGDGDEPAQDNESWVDWAYRNRWKIAAGAAATAAVAALAYWYFKGSSQEVPTTLGGGSAPPVPTPSVGVGPSASTVVSEATSHAWPLGKEYTAMDKLEGLLGTVPGGGAAVAMVKRYIDPSDSNSEELIAEIAKLASGPYGVAAGVWDNVARALSYYSSGKIEIGTTIDLLKQAGEGMQSMEASGIPATLFFPD